MTTTNEKETKMDPEQKIYNALIELLDRSKIVAEHDHTSSGEAVLSVKNLGLMVFIEIYDHNDGTHDVVPLRDLIHEITHWEDAIST